MARIFDDISNNTPANVYAGGPVAEFKALNEDASKQYQNNLTNTNALEISLNNLDLEDRNTDIKKRVIAETKAKLQSLHDKGDYQDAGFLIDKVKKDLLTDQELNGAIKSREAERNYYATQKEKYDKGEISRQDYLTGLAMSKLNNKNKLAYDPNTMTVANSFIGRDIVKDQSDDIAKEVMETIKDWKPNTSKEINGTSYTVKNLGGINKVFVNGEEVSYNEVANALKQHILNQDKYKDYLNQKTEFSKFNLLTDPTTGQKRNFDRNDLSYLKDDEIQKLVTGYSENDIKKLEASKKPEDQAAAKEIKTALAEVNLKDPSTLENAYDKFQRDNTLTGMVYPAAEKASYQKLDYKLFNDDAALEDLKFRHAKALKKYENDLTTQGLPPITNTSTVQKYTGTQYAEVQKNMQQYKSDYNQKLAAFNEVRDHPSTDPLRQTREKDMLDAQTTLNVAKTHTENFYSNLTDDAKIKIQTRVAGMFEPDEGALSNWDYRISKDKLDELIKISAENKDYALQSRLLVTKEKFQNKESLGKEWANNLSSMLTKSQYLPTLNEADDERVQRATGFGAYKSGGNSESGFPTLVGSETGLLGSIGGTLLHHTTWNTRISNIMQKEYETNNNMVSTNDIVTIPDVGKDNSPAAKSYHAIARSTFDNATEWIDPSGISFDKLLGGKFYKRGSKGELVETTPDITQSQIAPAPGSNDGMTRVQVTLKDKDGQELLSDGSDGEQRGSFILKSGNPEASKMIYTAAAEYAKQNNDLQSYYKLKGDENFGKYFAPIAIGTDSDPITIFFPDGTKTTIKMKSDGNDASKVFYAETGRPVFDKTFRSKEDLMKTFQIAYENGQK